MTITANIIGGAPVTEAKKMSPKDNLYMAVNAEWIQQAQIPADKPTTGTFQHMDEAVHEQLMDDFDRYHQGKLTSPNPLFTEAMKMHQVALDFDRRKEEGMKPLHYALRHIRSFNQLDELKDGLAFWIKENLPLPFKVSVAPNWKDTSKNALFLDVPNLILPDKTYYTSQHPEKDKLLQTWQEMVATLLQKLDYSAKEADTIAKEAISFDARLVPYVMTAEEAADVTKIYHPIKTTDIHYSQYLDLQKMIHDLLDTTPEEVIVTQPDFFNAFDQIINPSQFTELKSWMLATAVVSWAPYL